MVTAEVRSQHWVDCTAGIAKSLGETCIVERGRLGCRRAIVPAREKKRGGPTSKGDGWTEGRVKSEWEAVQTQVINWV